jgi:hypothetical protein
VSETEINIEVNILPGPEGKRAMLTANCGSGGGVLTKAGAEVMAAVRLSTYDGRKERHTGGVAPDGRKSFQKFAEEGWLGLESAERVRPWHQAVDLAVRAGHEPPPAEGLWIVTFNWQMFYDAARGVPWKEIPDWALSRDEDGEDAGEGAEGEDTGEATGRDEESLRRDLEESLLDANHSRYDTVERVAKKFFDRVSELEAPLDAYSRGKARTIGGYGHAAGDLMDETLGRAEAS